MKISGQLSALERWEAGLGRLRSFAAGRRVGRQRVMWRPRAGDGGRGGAGERGTRSLLCGAEQAPRGAPFPQRAGSRPLRCGLRPLSLTAEAVRSPTRARPGAAGGVFGSSGLSHWPKGLRDSDGLWARVGAVAVAWGAGFHLPQPAP